MHHPKDDIDRIYMKRKEVGRGLLQSAVTHKAQIINISEYLNTKYAEDQFVNIVKSHESHQTNMNPSIKMAAMVAEELNRSNDNSDKKGRHSTHRSKNRRVHKEKVGKQRNVWPVCQKYGQTAY